MLLLPNGITHGPFQLGRVKLPFNQIVHRARLHRTPIDIRLMLAEQLTKADRKTEALEQLQTLYARYESGGRTAEAQATFERMKAIDPNAEAKSPDALQRAKSDDLVFIDLDAPTPRVSRITRGISTKIAMTPPVPVQVVPPTPAEKPPVESRPSAGAILGLEPTAIGDAAVAEPAPLPASEFAEIDLTAIPEAPPTAPVSASDLALPGDLPMINLDGTPAAGTI